MPRLVRLKARERRADYGLAGWGAKARRDSTDLLGQMASRRLKPALAVVVAADLAVREALAEDLAVPAAEGDSAAGGAVDLAADPEVAADFRDAAVRGPAE